MLHAVRPNLVVLIVALAAILIASAAACGGDSEPEPTPTAMPVPTPTAEPTPMPEPAPLTPVPAPMPTPAPAAPSPAPEAAQPTGSMRDFVLDESSTGKALMDRLSEEEVTCVQAAFGETVYQFILGMKLLSAGADRGSAAQLFSCLSQDNIVLYGAAFVSAQAGLESEESRQCISELSLEHPELIYANMGLEWEGQQTGHTSQHEFTVQFYDCLTYPDAARYFTRTWKNMATAHIVEGSDIVGALTDSEVDCFRDYFGDTYDEAFLDANVTSGDLGSSELREACYTADGAARLFVAIMSIHLDGLTDATKTCLADFANEHEHYVDNLILTTPDVLEELNEEELAERAQDSGRWLDCMAEEELRRWQDLIATANRAAGS